jgi:hypothetical protein
VRKYIHGHASNSQSLRIYEWRSGSGANIFSFCELSFFIFPVTKIIYLALSGFKIDFMIYSFTRTDDAINGILPVSSKEALAFVYETIALAAKADVKIENMHDEQLAAVYDDAGVQTNYYDNTLFLTKKPLSVSGTLLKDFSSNPQHAVAFAIVCAAKELLADLKGLEFFTKDNGTGVIASFQKEMYRFEINTDFCDHSKLKIYTNKGMQQKARPVRMGGSGFAGIAFIPLAMVFGNIEIEMADDFETSHEELVSLFGALNLRLEKR